MPCPWLWAGVGCEEFREKADFIPHETCLHSVTDNCFWNGVKYPACVIFWYISFSPVMMLITPEAPLPM